MEKFEYTIRLCFSNKGIFFGPGTAELLKNVYEYKSLNKAAKSMDMAYSKAWKIIKEAEAKFGFPLLSRTIGGVGGGGSDLTYEGKDVLDKYTLFNEKIKSYSNGLFLEIFNMDKVDLL